MNPFPTRVPPDQQAIRDRCVHPRGAFVEFGIDQIEQSIPSRFEAQVRLHPRRVALKSREREWTYQELNQDANRVARALLAQRGEREEPVALLFEPGASFVVASLGALKAGKIVVPLESTFPRDRLQYMLEQSDSAMVVTDAAHAANARSLTTRPILNLDALDASGSGTDPKITVSPDSPVSIGYTSGSTGQPKGIVWSHRGMLHAVMRHTNLYRVCPEDRLMTFRASIRAYLYALLNGASYAPFHLHEQEPADVARVLREQQITLYRGAVSTFRSLASSLSTSDAFPYLRLVALFGEPLYHSEVELFRRHFGEHTILTSSLGCNEFDDYAWFFLDHHTPLKDGIVPGGYPREDVDVRLLDEDGRDAGVDEVGEIAIRSRYNAIGYWQRPDLTQAAFLHCPGQDDQRTYRTGDMGRRQADGCLFHLGRKDFQVKIRGFRVEISEVETALLRLDGVKHAVVTGHQAGPGDTRLVAYILPSEQRQPTTSELRRGLRDKLPHYMIPSIFVMVAAMPLTATGKVDRRSLPAPDHTRPLLDQEYAPARTPIEESLARIWAEVLRVDRVGIHDNFFDLGGDSLLATRVMTRVAGEFDAEVSLRALFDAPTVAGLAEVVRPQTAAARRDDSMERALQELDQLTEEQADRLLRETTDNHG